MKIKTNLTTNQLMSAIIGLLGGICFVMGFYIGIATGINKTRQDAIDYQAGEYRIENQFKGNTKFYWNTQPKSVRQFGETNDETNNVDKTKILYVAELFVVTSALVYGVPAVITSLPAKMFCNSI